MYMAGFLMFLVFEFGVQPRLLCSVTFMIARIDRTLRFSNFRYIIGSRRSRKDSLHSFLCNGLKREASLW